jgi:hypothetical protein
MLENEDRERGRCPEVRVNQLEFAQTAVQPLFRD